MKSYKYMNTKNWKGLIRYQHNKKNNSSDNFISYNDKLCGICTAWIR